MIIKALDQGGFCVWNGFLHKPIDQQIFPTLAAAEKHLDQIENMIRAKGALLS